MFDKLLEEDPWVQELQARSREEEKLKSARDTLIDIVRLRFPSLTSLAEIRALQMEKPEILRLLLRQIVQAPDENVARAILETYPNS